MGVAPRWPNGSTIYRVASNLSFSRSTTVHLAGILPGYGSYTSDDFVVSLKGGRSENYGEISGRVIWAGYNYPNVAYDPSTGDLTLTGHGPSIMYSGGVYSNGNSVVDIYAVKHVKDVSA